MGERTWRSAQRREETGRVNPFTKPESVLPILATSPAMEGINRTPRRRGHSPIIIVAGKQPMTSPQARVKSWRTKTQIGEFLPDFDHVVTWDLSFMAVTSISDHQTVADLSPISR